MSNGNQDADELFYRQKAGALVEYVAQVWGLSYGEHYTIEEPVSGPRTLALPFLVNPCYRRDFEARRKEFEMALSLNEGEAIRPHLAAGGRLVFEIPKPRSLWYDVPASSLPLMPGLAVCIGVDAANRPVVLDFAEPLTSQLLVAGFTGSGKTFFLRWLVSRLAAQNLPGRVGFVLTDTEKEGIQWRDFARLAHLLHPIITDEAEAGRLLSWALEEIPRRAASGKREPKDVFLVMDETQGLLLNKGVARMAARVSGLGREVGVHLVLAVRNPNKDELGDDINTKRNMARVVFKVADGIMAAVATGRAKSGAEFLAGPGDALLLETEGGMVRLATAIAPPEAIASLPQAASLPRLPLDAPKDNDEARGTEPEKGHGGRKPEPMNAKALAYYLFHPRASQNQVQGFLRERTGHGINWERLPEHQEMAAEMRAEIEAKGWTFSAEGNRTEDG